MRVFVTYSAKDKDWARKLVDDLRQSGFEVWDPAMEVIPGQNWALQIGHALERSDAMVALVSPAAVDSENFIHDVEYALGAKRFRDRLIPVIVRPTTKMPWILKRLTPESGNPVEVGRRIAARLKGRKAAA